MSLIKDFLSLFNTGIAKLTLILVILTVCIGYIKQRENSIYEAGFNASQASYMLAEQTLRDELYAEYSIKIDELTRQLTASQETSTSSSAKAAELQRRLDNRPAIEVARQISGVESTCVLSEDYSSIVKQLINRGQNEGVVK